MILESADKIHKIAAEYIESCDIDDDLAQSIKKRAEQGQFNYRFQGELDNLIEQKLWRMQYRIYTKRIGDKIYTKISW